MAAWTVEVRPPIEYVMCTEHQLGEHVDDDGVGDDGGGDVDGHGDGDACVDGDGQCGVHQHSFHSHKPHPH